MLAATNLRKNQPGGEHITIIMYDDNEPPKNYIWGKPDGFLYEWNGTKWVRLNNKSQLESHNSGQPATEQSIQSIIANKQLITKTELEAKIRMVKSEIISYLSKLINAKDCPDSDGENAIRWFRDQVLPEINTIKNQLNHLGLDNYATHTELNALREELLDAIDGLSSSAIVSELISRIEVLEALPHSTYVTQEQLLDAISNVASSQTITNINNIINNLSTEVTNLRNAINTINNSINSINNNITNIQGDITNIRGDITNIQGDITNIQGDITTINGNIELNEFAVASALNDLNDRILDIDSKIANVDMFDGLGYVTAEEVDDIHSIVIDEDEPHLM